MVTNYSLVIGQRLDGGAEISVVPTEDRSYSDEHPAVLYVLRSFIYEIRIQANRQTVRASELFNTQNIFFILFSKENIS